MQTKIDYRFKLLYAIAMIMIVASHAQGGSISLEISGWFPYGGLHIVLFIFGAGYFYKIGSEQNMGAYLLKKITHLIVPLYLYNFVYGLLVWLLHFKGFQIGELPNVYNLFVAPITNGHQYMYNLAGWFVMPLFMAEMTYAIIRRSLLLIHRNMPECVFFIMAVLGGVAGCYLATRDLNTGWWLVLVRMLLFMVFYAFGVFFHQTLETYDQKIPAFWYFSMLFLIKFVIICRYHKSPDYVLSWCNNFTEGPVLPIIVGILGILFWMRVVSILAPVIGKSKYVNLIADHTYSIMMNQFLGFMLLKLAFAVIAIITGIFADFDMVAFKTDVWWLYLPYGISQTKILYLIAGIVIPITMQKCMCAVVTKKKRVWEDKARIKRKENL